MDLYPHSLEVPSVLNRGAPQSRMDNNRSAGGVSAFTTDVMSSAPTICAIGVREVGGDRKFEYCWAPVGSPFTII